MAYRTELFPLDSGGRKPKMKQAGVVSPEASVLGFRWPSCLCVVCVHTCLCHCLCILISSSYKDISPGIRVHPDNLILP